MARRKPTSLRIRTFQVGFGDCFLLTFRYASSERHVLIDFGSSARPESARALDEIAGQIKEMCGGKLHAIVATHRHRDHISGFATREDGTGAGDIIASCKPSVVVQPWTEDPDAATDALAPTRRYGQGSRGLVERLGLMEDMASAIKALAPQLSAGSKGLRDTIAFVGELNISNRSAVENLMAMGKRGTARYVYFNSPSGLGRVLPGVEIKVLGPPTLTQSEAIRKQRSRDENEYWHLQASGLAEAAPSDDGSPRIVFPDAENYTTTPIWARWLTRRLDDMSAESLFELVRTLDHQMNNTSVILLFKVENLSTLFPGDAQIENWRYALSKPSTCKLLEGVDVYKVGHHGSLNATPKSLWELFKHRGGKSSRRRMHSVNSTMKDKHGSKSKRTEVPRGTLVEALEADTHYFSTETIKETERNYRDIEMDFRTQGVRLVEP